MTASLPQVSLEHHDRLMRHVDAMTAVGDLVGAAPVAELRPRVDEMAGVPQRAAPAAHGGGRAHPLPELERMLQNRHSMTPMRREHDEIRTAGGRTRPPAGSGSTPDRCTPSETVALRRVIFRLYAMLKVHLAEEQLYLGIIEHGVSAEGAEKLAAAMDHSGITAF